MVGPSLSHISLLPYLMSRDLIYQSLVLNDKIFEG